jgi:hypothetical protein
MMTAVGAMNAVEEIFGRLPLYSMIIRILPPGRRCSKISFEFWIGAVGTN